MFLFFSIDNLNFLLIFQVKQQSIQQQITLESCYIIINLLIYQEMSSPRNISQRNSPARDLQLLSPSKNDLNFLARKIARLEQDYRQVCDQLQKARNRLRKAQDFQIKYDLMSKQISNFQTQSRSKDLLLAQYQTQIRQLQILNSQNKNIEITYKVQRDNLNRQIQDWRLRYFQAQQISSKIRAQQQYKMNQKLSKQLQILKKSFVNQQEQLKNKIRILQINLSQKQTVEQVLKSKNQKQNNQKSNEIQRLEQNLNNLRTEHLYYVKQKNQEIINVGKKFQDIFNHEIEKLKSYQDNNNDKFAIQLQGLKGILQVKNNQINELIKQNQQLRQKFQQQKINLLKQITYLKQKIYQRQRQNELQLYNMKQRLITLHKSDTQNMKDNFQKINLNLQDNIKQLQNLLRNRQKQIFELNQKFQNNKNQLLQTIEAKNLAIAQLQDTIRHTGDINAKQIDNLHSSFHKITTQKGLLSTQYQNTFNFLNNQISKLTSSNQLKNQQIKDLHFQLSQLKKNFSQHIKDLQKKWRQQRKQREQQRDKQRDLRQKLQQEFREKQQKWRHRQRMLERDKQKQERQKIKLKVTIEELQKNVQRLTKHVKQNQNRLKQQMQKNQSNFVQTGSMRRQLTGQIQRQKSELQAIKKLQLDQVHRQYQIQITRLTNQNQKLMNQLTDLKLNFDKLQQQYKKVKLTNKNIDRINKQKMVQYERKMATLNAQINLTQNLYNSFISAKSRIVKKGPQN